jgi:hypothetical protein
MKLRRPASSAWHRPSVYALSIAFAIGWTILAGKDVPWDALHYHLYAGYSAAQNRLGVDFFPAGAQAYLNPYSHLPLYWMVSANWPSLAIGVAFACLHAVMLWLVYEMARIVSLRPDGTSPAAVGIAAVALAAMNPILLQELGSSFNDITTGTLAVGGYVALVTAFYDQRLRWVVLGGLLLGASAALKLSNAVLALLPALPLVWGCFARGRMRPISLMVFGVASGFASLLLFSPWSWQLAQAFGNPFFPRFGQFFAPHPDMVPVAAAAIQLPVTASTGVIESLVNVFHSMRDPRFLPADLWEALLRPLEMMRPRRLIHTEVMASDMRYAGLLMLLPVLMMAGWAARRLHGPQVADTEPSRPLAWLAASFLTGWIVWLAISGNSRYFLPMACIASVLLVAGVYRTLAPWPRVRACMLVFLLGVQALFLFHGTDRRWNSQPWDGPWVQVTLPQRLLTEPFLYLPMDSQSQSFLLPLMAPGSSFIGIVHGFPPSGAFENYALRRIERNIGRARTLKLVQALESDGRPVAPHPSTYDHPLKALGLQVDTRDCEIISYRGNPSVIERQGPRSGPRDKVYIQSCRVVPGPRAYETDMANQETADMVLDRLEEQCPKLLPAGPRSTRSGEIWRRSYGDLVAWVNDDGRVRFTDLIRGGGDVTELGLAKDWLIAPRKLKCWRERGQGRIEIVNQ